MSLAETAVGVDGAFTSIPIIDLSKCDTPTGRLATAYEVRDACMRVGFFCIRNHGMPQRYLDNVLAAMKKYFSLPMETKMKLYHKEHNFRGYSPPLDPMSNKKHGDFNEGFRIAWEEIEAKAHDKKRENDGVMAGANVWPSDDYPEFREACLEYYHAAVKVGKILFPLFALALGLSETYFDEKTQNSTAMMKVLHYPLPTEYSDILDDIPGITGFTAHTDFEIFTILWQQPGVQALQIMNSEKRWIDVPAIEGTLVINLGDQLAMMTNDIFKSVVHRVMNKSDEERYSIPLFFGVDYHVNIEPVPGCVSADRPAKYKPITAGEHVHKRFKDVYA